MTHQNHQTNGASLEDCHTNFFALTELYGIKWRKLVWGETSGGGEGEEGAAPLADPVISSYARCLAGDILCVWRRVPAPQPPPDIYETPAPAPPPPLSLRAAKELWIFWYGEEPDLNGLVAPELIASQGDQGSWESGLSYECRSLLFKALHNLIERCLLSRDFVRLGKWFVQPYDGDEEDVGKSPWHLSFSFAFFLHGESTVCASVDVRQHPPVRTLTAKRLAKLNSSDHQPEAKVILAPFGLEGTVTGREWSDSDAPTARLLDAWRQLYPLEQGCGAVEVICGGARMRYPLPYALLTDALAPPPPPPPAAALATRTLHALTTPLPHQTAEICYSTGSADREDFVEPTRKMPCSCAKWRRRRPPRPAPFHRRALRPAAAPPRPPPLPKHPAHHAPHATHATHAPRAPGGCRSGAEGPHGGCGRGSGGALSPGSCGAASPPHPGSAPPSAGPAPTEPSPTEHHHLNQSGGAMPTTLHTPAPTPDPHAPPTPAPPSAPPPKHYAQGESPLGAGGAAGGATGGAAGGEVSRRPVLASPERRLDPLEDEHSLHMLYDYTTVLAWLEHPVKRFKSSQSLFREELALGAALGADLYAGHEHTRMAAMPAPDPRRLDIKQEQEDVKEYKNLFTSDGLCPTLKDLEQIFDNSDDAASGDETVRLLQVQTPPDSNKSADESRCAGRCVRAEELSKMFPTPPSMEAHAQPSPGFTLLDDAPQGHHAHHPGGSPPPDPIEDWSYVFKPPTLCKYVGSSKYAPLTTLPSQLLPPVTLPPHSVYRPRWQQAAPPDPDAPPDPPPDTRTGVKRSASPAGSPREPRARRPEAEGGTPAAATSPAASHAAPAEPAVEPRVAHVACPLLVNVLLADTVLNVFRDHNFDSCTLCVCNAGPKVVGNIRGADAATYLPSTAGGGWDDEDATPDDEPSRCTCGFSAIVNRRLAHRAGLFYEDEMEITGIAVEPGGGGARGGRLAEVLGVVALQVAGPGGGSTSALQRAAQRAALPPPHHATALNQREYADGGAAAARALRAACGSSPGGASAIHRWPFIGARAPRSSRDVVRLMRRLRPLLQDAIQKRCCGARMWDGVTGPLTWRQFHRLAGRGNEDLCEPQPVPPLLVGHDRDWVSLSPYALRHWERLALEPYAYARDVTYVVLAADAEALTDPLRSFFRELSAAYESCRLGRHRPLSRLARDGIYRAAPDPRDRQDDWLTDPPPGRLGEYLRAYADALRSTLLPLLASTNLDRAAAAPTPPARVPSPQPPTPMRPPSTPEPSSQSDAEDTSTGAGGAGGPGGRAWEEEEGGAGALVLYLVEPPAAHAHRPAALHALLRLAARAHHLLAHHNPLVKIISLEGVCEAWGAGAVGPRARLQRVLRRAAAARAHAHRQVAHGLRHTCRRQPVPQQQGRKEPRAIQAVLAGVGAGAAAGAEGGGGDLGAGLRRPGRGAVPVLLPVARPALAAGRRHRRARRAARHRRHQHTRAAQVSSETVRTGAAAGPQEADGLHAGRHVAGGAAMAARRGPRGPHRPRRAEGLELAALPQEPCARVVDAARDLRQLQRAVPGRHAVHRVRLPRVHGAGLVPAPHGGPVHARRALQPGLDTVAPAHAARRQRHSHTRLPHLGHYAVKPDAVRAADGERRRERHDVPGRGHGGRGHRRGQHDGAADRRHVQPHVAAGQPTQLAATRRPRARRRALARPRRAPAPLRRAPRPQRGAGGHGAAAAAGAGLHGVDGAAGRHAGLVVGRLRTPARRLPRLPQERAAPARGQPAVRRHVLALAATRPQRAPARQPAHHGRAQIRARRLQRAVVAGAGRQHARPPLLPAAARAGAHAAVPHRRRPRLAGATVRGCTRLYAAVRDCTRLYATVRGCTRLYRPSATAAPRTRRAT